LPFQISALKGIHGQFKTVLLIGVQSVYNNKAKYPQAMRINFNIRKPADI
jgi:hypothetical protein